MLPLFFGSEILAAFENEGASKNTESFGGRDLYSYHSITAPVLISDIESLWDSLDKIISNNGSFWRFHFIPNIYNPSIQNAKLYQKNSRYLGRLLCSKSRVANPVMHAQPTSLNANAMHRAGRRLGKVFWVDYTRVFLGKTGRKLWLST